MHRRLPVTLVGGFLGAGKSSLMHHLITEHQGGHLAILVNSPGALNFDAKALRGLCGAMGRTYHQVEEIRAGSNETDAALHQLHELAKSGLYERAIVEISGTTDAALWARHFAKADGGPEAFASWAELEQVVCIIDLLEFGQTFTVADREPISAALKSFQRAQVEGATVLVLNKCDLASDSQRQVSTRLLREMNGHALIIETSFGEVAPDVLFHAASAPALQHTLTAKSNTEEQALESLLFRAHRPFHPQRFWDWFNAPDDGLLRVKGLVWLATRNLLVGGISRTRWQNGCGAAGIWWAALPREEWPRSPQSLDQIQANWREPYGDRRQELMLLGEKGATMAAARRLNGCLLNEAEYARPVGEWTKFPDPFPAWDLES